MPTFFMYFVNFLKLAFRYLPCFKFEFSYFQAGFVKFTVILGILKELQDTGEKVQTP